MREEKVKLNEAIKTKTIIMNNSDRQRYLLMIKEHRIPNSIHQIEKRYINGNKKEFEHVIINLSCVKEETIKIPTVVRLESTDDLSLYYIKITRKELIEKKKIILEKQGSWLHDMKERLDIEIELSGEEFKKSLKKSMKEWRKTQEFKKDQLDLITKPVELVSSKLLTSSRRNSYNPLENNEYISHLNHSPEISQQIESTNSLESNQNCNQPSNENQMNQINQQQHQIIQETLFIPYEMVLKGGIKQETYFNQTFVFEIIKGVNEGSYFTLENIIDIETQIVYTIFVVIQYEESYYYQRNGNDLIGVFKYRKDQEGTMIIPLYPIFGEVSTPIILKETVLTIPNKGFFDSETQTYGNYVIHIVLV